MYKATISFAMDDLRTVKQGQILQGEDFKSEAEKNDLLECGHIVEYDGTLEIYENGLYDVREYENADVDVQAPEPTLQAKSVTITTNGSENVSADTGYDGLSSVGITTNVQPNLESKSVTITENTTTTITPTSGKDGLSSVEVTTNVSGDLSEYFVTEITSNTASDLDSFHVGTFTKKLPEMTIASTVTSMSNAFRNNNDATNLLEIEKISGGQNVTSYYYFLAGWASMLQIDISELDTENATNMGAMFGWCSGLTTLDFSNFDTQKVSSMYRMFINCTGFTSLDLGGFETPLLTNVGQMFRGCTNLTHIDIRNMTFNNISSSSDMFGASASAGVPNDCEIIVKSDTEKTWITSNFSRLTNVKTVAEYEAS